MKRPLILVADDDLDDRFLLQAAFAENGNQEDLAFVENGAEVMDYLSNMEYDDTTRYPDIIILDLNMPKKNGKEVLFELKKHPRFKHIPVIIYTTTKNDQEIRKCYELGANTYIVKPISVETLKEVVLSIRTYWLGTASIAAVN
jgi:CheY-like chemotaxis protein